MRYEVAASEMGMHRARSLALVGSVAALGGCTDAPLASRPDPNASAATDDEACVPPGTPCAVEFRYPLWGAHSVELRGNFKPDGWDNGVPLQIEGSTWRTAVPAPNGTVIQYKFVLNGSEWVVDPINPSKQQDGLGGENSVVTVSCEHRVCPVDEPPPNAAAFDWRSAVLYFVFVDRFRNGDPTNDLPVGGVETAANYQGGDWAGVIEAIDNGYFDDLGVNALWITVPMDNPNAPGVGSDGHQHSGYHGYWPSDLDRTEEHFGDLDLFKTLVERAHARGIKVLVDYAMNHVHEQAALFAQHPDWFWPLDYNGKECVCGGGCDWNDGYEQKRCWFTPYLPDWNFQSPAARAHSVDNAVAWIQKTGIDGYRLDAVKHIEMQWILDLRKRVTEEIEPKTGEHFYMVGETFESSNRDLLASFVGADKLDGQFDFPLRAVAVEILLRRTGTMFDLDGFVASNDGFYNGVMSTFLGNHDIGRIVHTALDQPWDAWAKGDPWGAPPALPTDAAPFERLAVGFTFLFTSKGIPLVYYGDEIGLPGAGDPDNRRFMQWEGLSEHQLALRAHLSKLGAIRRDHPALWRGHRTRLGVTSDTYSYSMSDGADVVYVGLNRGDATAAVGGMPRQGRDLLTGAPLGGPSLNLGPRSSVVVVPE
jgi:glycosidase